MSICLTARSQSRDFKLSIDALRAGAVLTVPARIKYNRRKAQLKNRGDYDEE